ncbi:glutathione S-transferase family protein [Methylovirgula sp. 4M-Z18]|uniref:glutathione S-transferase family protein n=1 Tax=Methylovirgula sp. 4M-Z18 TaxID=2293567 RepID=UPI000E2FDDFF|nr:glutathione S-transferase family protein [Methylovirgula sp. 4M-Z18]RFB81544.1 glutathione S-transferase family protein [Methylovirgula sp. 4M-Z18]
MPVKLVILGKSYSSWSMRPWLLLAQMNIPFEEVLIHYGASDQAKKLRKYSPTQKCPVLYDGDIQIWESLAIIEYLAEKFPKKNIWPKTRAARAHARSICAEMHAGFQAMRQHLPTQFLRPVRKRELTPEAAADVKRIEQIWKETRKTYGKGGPFLFGKFCAADAMFAPVVNRLHTYDAEVSKATRTYMDAIMALPAWNAWIKDAEAEPKVATAYDDY